ncbi:MAG: hypothetical protein LBQ43_01980, partial [Holosporales bacterium]|nr:hypothetical protein [Holosporales bacterium]
CETGLTRLDLSACNRVFSSSYGDPINNATRVLDRIFGANINQLLWPDGHRELTEAELQVKRRERISENCTVILPGGMGTLVHHNGVWQKQ